MKKILILMVFCLVPFGLSAWTNGELLIWMDAERGHGREPIVKKLEDDRGIRVTIETPEKITDSFPIAAQAGKGPDIVIWAHDKVGEWADAGLIAQWRSQMNFQQIPPEILAGGASSRVDLGISR